MLGQWSDRAEPASPSDGASVPAGLADLADLLRGEDVAIPAMYGLPVGHAPTSRPLLLGARATVNFSAGRMRVEAV